MKEIEFNLDKNPFINFLSARYTMSARINVEKLWNWCHENNKSFFIMSLGCLMNAVNSVPELKRRIINKKVIEYDYVKNLSKNILTSKQEGFTIEMEKRDFENIANFSCIPWVDFDMITNCAVHGKAIQPLITWGKVNDNFEMSVAITVSHIFVNGRELGYFYENAQNEFNKF